MVGKCGSFDAYYQTSSFWKNIKYGYVANQVQNEQIINIMKYAFTIVPGMLWLCTAIVLFFYRLNKKRYNEIVEVL